MELPVVIFASTAVIGMGFPGKIQILLGLASVQQVCKVAKPADPLCRRTRCRSVIHPLGTCLGFAWNDSDVSWLRKGSGKLTTPSQALARNPVLIGSRMSIACPVPSQPYLVSDGNDIETMFSVAKGVSLE